MGKKTLLFSNIVGDIFSKNDNVKFNQYMEEYLKEVLNEKYSLVFINAPGLGNEENYLSNIIQCFRNISIEFDNILDIENDTDIKDILDFIDKNSNIIYFFMGGNPITQMQIIKKYRLEEIIKNYEGLVIGFCAGAINLSKYSIVTSDEDFHEPSSYLGIGRIQISIEPHYNTTTNDKRNKEIDEFAQKYNSKIYAIPDESIIIVEDNNIFEKGTIYYFGN